MASSRRSRPADAHAGRSDAVAALRGALADALARHAIDSQRVAVALSGGRDSTALLDAVCAVAQPRRLEIVACHVHHGLSPHADAWQQACAAACAARRVAFAARQVLIPPTPRVSVEAAARAARYEALAAMAHETTARCV